MAKCPPRRLEILLTIHQMTSNDTAQMTAPTNLPLDSLKQMGGGSWLMLFFPCSKDCFTQTEDLNPMSVAVVILVPTRLLNKRSNEYRPHCPGDHVKHATE